MKKRMMLQSNKKSKKGRKPEKATKKGQKRKLEDKPECSKDEERKRKEKEAKKKQKATNQNIISQRVEGLLKKMSSVAEERFSAASDDDLIHSCADILRPALPYHQRSPPPLPRMPEACINPSLRPNCATPAANQEIGPEIPQPGAWGQNAILKAKCGDEVPPKNEWQQY